MVTVKCVMLSKSYDMSNVRAPFVKSRFQTLSFRKKQYSYKFNLQWQPNTNFRVYESTISSTAIQINDQLLMAPVILIRENGTPLTVSDVIENHKTFTFGTIVDCRTTQEETQAQTT